MIWSARTQDFRKRFAQLPQRVQATAKKNYRLWQDNPAHPSLEFKRISTKQNIWSVRVGIGWRALGVLKENRHLQVLKSLLENDFGDLHCESIWPLFMRIRGFEPLIN